MRAGWSFCNTERLRQKYEALFWKCHDYGNDVIDIRPEYNEQVRREMGSLSRLRCKNTATIPAKDSAKGLSALFPSANRRVSSMHRILKLKSSISKTQRRSADRDFWGHVLHLFWEENYEKNIDTKARPTRDCQLSFLHGGSRICAARLSRL